MCSKCWKLISLTTENYFKDKKGYFCLGCSKNIRGVTGDKE